MRTTVLIASVGFNPASVVLAARALEPRPSRVILLCTKETDPIASILPSQLGVPLCDIVEVPPDPAVEAARDYLVRELSIDASEDPVLDITGATKPLAIAAWLALAQLRPGFRAVYLAPSGKLRDANTGKPLPGEASISLRELLAWKSVAVQSVEWEGPIAAPPKRLRPRLAFYAEIFSNFSAVTHSGNALVTEFSPQAPLPPGFKQLGDKIEEPEDSGVFFHHRWLEEFCLLRAHSLLRAESDVTAALGVKLRSPGTSEGNDEADVVLLRGGRVLVIEAKAREQPGGSGAQLQKRIAKTRTFFGDLAKVLFVHPGYNAPALRVNRSMVDGRYVRIVGSDLTELDSAICWGIG